MSGPTMERGQGRGSPVRWIGALALVVSVVATSAPAPAFALSATAEATPSTIAYYGPEDPRTTRDVVHRLHLQASGKDERWWLLLTTDRTPVAPGELVVEGPGTLGDLGPVMSTHGDPGPPVSRDACPFRPSYTYTMRWPLTLPPAGSASTLVLHRRLALTSAPAGPTRLALRWTLQPRDTPAPPMGLDVVAAEPEPTLEGLRPALLNLTVGTASGRSVGARQTATIGPDEAVMLAGELAPVRAGQPIVVWAYQ